MSADPRDELIEIARLLQNQLAWQRELGSPELPRVLAARPAEPPRAEPPRAEPPRAEPPRAEPPRAEPPRAEPLAEDVSTEPPTEDPRRRALRVIEAEVRGCVACKLSQRRTQTVFARGNPAARLMFVGEGPGEQEDKQGLPFVGPAGQLLDKIIGAMGLSPDEVYICNVVKCRPPGNRTPEPDEVSACTPYLARQIEVVKPEVIVALGKTAAGFLLDSTAPMGKLRGQWHSYLGVPLLPTWHPSYLLREPARKADTWADMKLVMQRLGLSVPGTRRG